MSVFLRVRRGERATYIDTQSISTNTSGFSDFRAVISPDLSLPTVELGILSTIVPEEVNLTGATIASGVTTINPNGDEINSFYFYKVRIEIVISILSSL